MTTGGTGIYSPYVTSIGNVLGLSNVYISNVYTSSFTIKNQDLANAYYINWFAWVKQ